MTKKVWNVLFCCVCLFIDVLFKLNVHSVEIVLLNLTLVMLSPSFFMLHSTEDEISTAHKN